MEDFGDCPNCGAENVFILYCETCGNYGCIECRTHCPGCHTGMDEIGD